METERVYQIFQRSIKKHNFEANIQYLSDGESKSYLSVKNIYKGLEIKKLECAGRYQKKIGTRLHNLKKKERVLDGHGRLIGATIDHLQNFGGATILQNKGNLEKMKSSLLP